MGQHVLCPPGHHLQQSSVIGALAQFCDGKVRMHTRGMLGRQANYESACELEAGPDNTRELLSGSSSSSSSQDPSCNKHVYQLAALCGTQVHIAIRPE